MRSHSLLLPFRLVPLVGAKCCKHVLKDTLEDTLEDTLKDTLEDTLEDT